MRNVKTIIKEHLEQHGLGGLYNESDCCCYLDDLIPCESICDECVAGYHVPCDGKCDEPEDCKGHIVDVMP